MTYPEVIKTIRTANRPNHSEIKHALNTITVSPSEIDLPLDIWVQLYPMEYMHQACLRVMKHLLLIWLKG